MAERTVPWWRRALQAALDGIRTGFGLFARSQKSSPGALPEAPADPEETLEEETTLTDQFPNSAPAPESTPADAQPAPQTAPASAAEPAPALESPAPAPDEPTAVEPPAEPASESALEPPAAAQASPAPSESTPEEKPAAGDAAQADAQPAEEVTSAPEPQSAASVEPEPQPEARREETLSSIAEPEAEPTTVPEPQPEAEAAEEAPAVAAQPETDPEPETEEPAAEQTTEAAGEAETPREEMIAATEPELLSSAAASAPEASPAQPAAQPEEATPSPEAPSAAAPAAPQAQPTPPHTPTLIKRDDTDNPSPFSVFVGQVYDGPLDLLLDLIRKQDIDIYDIPIARITAQFLAYVNQLRASDMDVAGEFIYTASLLIHIKSKMLLPRAPSGPGEEAEDPRRELVERLLEHERFKNAAQMLQQKQMLEAASWTNPGLREFKSDVSAEPEIAADTVDLVRIFREILERARSRPVMDVQEDAVTVGQMIQFLARRLTMEDKPVSLRRLLSHTRSERALIAMFLALLELVRLQAILLRQDRHFSEIFVKKNTGFEEVMNQSLANAQDDWR